MKKKKVRYIIQDWAGNICFKGKLFKHFEDAWGFIREFHPDEDDWQEYYVEPVEQD